jgi:MacB-like periplasmic core domain/FtsX-like permease family
VAVATLSQDVRYAVRRIKDAPLFTVAAILTLALGLGVNSAVLSFANTIFVKPLRLPDPSRLVVVHQRRPNRPTTNSYPLSYPDYLYFRDHARTFASLAAHYATSPMHVSRAEGGFDVTGSVVTVSYFETLRLRAFLGRFFTSEEDRIPGRNPVAVLGHDLWRSRFGGDPRILGAVVRINGTDFTVVGVAQERFRGIQLQDPVDIWIPTAMFRVGYRFGVPLVEGREFDDRDRNGGPPVAIVNETLARRFWPRGGAAGSAIMLGATRVEVVGVVKDFEYLTALEQPRAIAYLDFWQQDTTQNWSHDSRTHIRGAGDAAALIPQIRRAIAAVDADVPVLNAEPLSVAIDTAFSPVRAARAFLLTFGALAMVLSTIGLYASLAFAVGQRTRELAIRMALGAARIDVGRLVLHRGAVLVLGGVVLGLLGAALAGPFLAHLLYGVSPRDPVALLAAPSLVVMVALVAMWLPARRAMALDPMTALRSE